MSSLAPYSSESKHPFALNQCKGPSENNYIKISQKNNIFYQILLNSCDLSGEFFLLK